VYRHFAASSVLLRARISWRGLFQRRTLPESVALAHTVEGEHGKTSLDRHRANDGSASSQLSRSSQSGPSYVDHATGRGVAFGPQDELVVVENDGIHVWEARRLATAKLAPPFRPWTIRADE
jgi:hypothetical protein